MSPDYRQRLALVNYREYTGRTARSAAGRISRAAERRRHRSQLDNYRRQLWAWNERLNLTRHTTLEKFVSRDVVDSHQLSNLLQRGERVLDVGTGGGVPGVVLAILRPDLLAKSASSSRFLPRAPKNCCR
jgi:16S rRNA G527 N7-methylase RsmG